MAANNTHAHAALERYLHEHIPLSRAMDVRVAQARLDFVELTAPLAPNINHRETVFGGSASALAILAAWTLLHLRLQDARHPARLVIQENTMRYDRPIVADFSAICEWRDDAAWQRFVTTLARRRRARITVASRLECGGETVGRLEGMFVALASDNGVRGS